MSHHESYIRGFRKLRRLVDALDPRLLSMVTEPRIKESRCDSDSDDPDLSTFLKNTRTRSLDKLAPNERDLLVRMVQVRKVLRVMEFDSVIAGDSESRILNICNNLFFPSQDVWYQDGTNGYGIIRRNYSEIAKTRARNRMLPNACRIEIYSSKRLATSSPSDRYYMLLHCWEELRIHKTRISILDVDRFSKTEQAELRGLDFHLVTAGDNSGRVWPIDGFMDLRSEHGDTDRKTLSDCKAKLDDLGHPSKSECLATVGDLAALCQQWGDIELTDALNIWERNFQTHRGRAIDQILAEDVPARVGPLDDAMPELIINEDRQTIEVEGRTIHWGGIKTWKPFVALWKARPEPVDLRRFTSGSPYDSANEVKRALRKHGLDWLANRIRPQYGVGYYIVSE